MAKETEQELLNRLIKARQNQKPDTSFTHPNSKPKNAATLIVIDGPAGKERLLMGKRNKNLKFMPGALVFPGGRVDRADHLVPACDRLEPEIENKLSRHVKGSNALSAPRALGVAAIRELAEETGLLVGRNSPHLSTHLDWQMFFDKGLAPAIGSLRLLGRAITPPRSIRRFDTWFFITRSDEISYTPKGGFSPSGELEELRWVSPQEAIEENTREITKLFIMELVNRLKADPQLDPLTPIPFYFSRNSRFYRQEI